MKIKFSLRTMAFVFLLAALICTQREILFDTLEWRYDSWQEYFEEMGESRQFFNDLERNRAKVKSDWALESFDRRAKLDIRSKHHGRGGGKPKWWVPMKYWKYLDESP